MIRNMKSAKDLALLSCEFRISILEMLRDAKSGHPGGSLSAIDLMTAVWFHSMKGVSDPKHLKDDRDRFVLSKGHGVPALYAILANLGFIEKSELPTLRRTGSRLQGHPDRVRLPIVEASTGSLGQGLSVAQGIAMGQRLNGYTNARTFCLLGDGEIQEGQVWEAALSCAKYKLSNLCAILDANDAQIDGKVSDVMPLEPLADKWRAFGWNVIELDGHDYPAILKALDQFEKDQKSDKPLFIVARTVKGKGVSFMEHKIEWHGVAPKAEECERAVAEIKKYALSLGGN